MTPLAEISESVPWFILACVLVCIVAMIGLSVTLRFVRELRENVAKELSAELESAKKRTPVDVQQPFVVQQHTEFATTAALKQVEKEAHGRMNRERDEAKERAEKLEQKLDAQTKEINGRVDLIPSRVVELLSRTKELHGR